MIEEEKFILAKKRKGPKQLGSNKKQLIMQQNTDDNRYMDLRDMMMPAYKNNQPLILSPDLTIIVETFNPLYVIALEFLMCVAEPTNRSEYIHEYIITQMSLYTAMVLQYSADDMIRVFDLLSKNHPPQQMIDFIKLHSQYVGQAVFYLEDKYYYVNLGTDVINIVLSKLKNKDTLQEIEQQSTEHAIEINPELKDFQNRIFINTEIIEQMASEIDTNKDLLAPKQEQLVKFKKFRICGDYFDVTQALISSFVPLIQEYDFKKESQLLDIQLKPQIQPRIYQLRAMKNIIIADKARSGLIVLPCGAGKTLVGVLCIEQIKSSAIIICDSNVSVDQWRREIERNTTVDHKLIIRVTGYVKDKWNGEYPVIVLTTYSWLIAQMTTNKQQQILPKNHPWSLIQDIQWGVCIVDEVHRLPALQFCNVLRAIKCAIKVGLTATLLREDMKLDNLYYMIGPKLYEENLMDLMNQGYLAKPHIVEVLCGMSPIFMEEYQNRANFNTKSVLHTGNPTKFKCLQFLIKHHEMLGHKIIVFCDSILILNYYAQKLGYPVIDGDLNTEEKNKIFNIFKNSNEIKTIFVSRVGDTGIDIPQASVGIEIGYLGGSRRQKVQRLGRVMRPKVSQNSDISAFFYSLASKDTSESEYSFKRQKYITEQLGLNTELLNEIDLPYNQYPSKYKFIKPMDEIELLEQILLTSNDNLLPTQPNYEQEELMNVIQVERTYRDELAGLYKFQ